MQATDVAEYLIHCEVIPFQLCYSCNWLRSGCGFRQHLNTLLAWIAWLSSPISHALLFHRQSVREQTDLGAGDLN